LTACRFFSLAPAAELAAPLIEQTGKENFEKVAKLFKSFCKKGKIAGFIFEPL
jgi:hypothetical protein